MLIEVDTHCHTIASTHAYSTVLEIVNCVGELGHKGLAVTDHSPCGIDAPHIWHFRNLKKALPRVINGVMMIFGSEVNILDGDGTVDMEESDLKSLDWIIASMHGGIMEELTEDGYTQAYIKLCRNPYVDVIGHCAVDSFKFDYEKCIKAFKEYEKLVEINESALNHRHMGIENYTEIIRICKKYEVPIVVNSDAHFCKNVGLVNVAERMLEEQGFPRQLVLNSDLDRVKEFIEKKRGDVFEKNKKV